MKMLDKDFNGHDEDGGGPCHTHLMAKGRVRGFVVGLFGEVSSDTRNHSTTLRGHDRVQSVEEIWFLQRE